MRIGTSRSLTPHALRGVVAPGHAYASNRSRVMHAGTITLIPSGTLKASASWVTAEAKVASSAVRAVSPVSLSPRSAASA